MRKYEQYKRLIKFLFSLNAILSVVIVHWLVWNGYYNKIIERPFWHRGNWLIVPLYASLLVFFYETYGGFRIAYLREGSLIWSQILSIIFVNIITYVQISLLDQGLQSIYPVLFMSLIKFCIVALWANTFRRIYRKMFPPKRLLLVYGDRPAFHLRGKISSREDKYYPEDAVHISMGREGMMKLAVNYDAIIIGDVPSHERNLLMKLRFKESIRTYSVSKISDILIRTSPELDIFNSSLLLSRNEGLQIEQRFVKRILDIVFSILGLTLSSPFFAVIVLMIKCAGRGAVFYRQDHLTQNGKVFSIYKFRTTIRDAKEDTGTRLASNHGDRILPVGEFLRRTRLGGLPQLWNILKGKMSVVGPRPERPELTEEIEKEIPEFHDRLKIEVGLTGYAQIYGKHNTTSYDKLKLDLSYVRRYSVFLDLRLILIMPKIMFMKESTEGAKEDGHNNGVNSVL